MTEKSPNIALGTQLKSQPWHASEDMITTKGYTDRFCNDLTGQASIDESVRSIDELLEAYEKWK